MSQTAEQEQEKPVAAPGAAKSDQPGGGKLPPPQYREKGEGREGAASGPRNGPQVVHALGHDQEVSAEEAGSALDWFLSTDPDDQGDLTKPIEINVGGQGAKAKWIIWTIKAVDLDELRRIQKLSDRISRRSDGDDMQANLRVVVAGTLDPDLTEAARSRGVADPAMALRQRFASKPGLLGQIAAEIMGLSGFDDEDVREANAAGN